MSLPHFFAGAPDPGASLTLSPEDVRHALRSLRLAPGDRFTTSDGRGALAVCRVLQAGGGALVGVVEERTVRDRPRPAISVLLAAPKGDRLAWAVQKLTELSVDRIVVLDTDRSVRRWGDERAERVATRLDKVAREAAKQSRRTFLPEVAGPREWDAALREAADAAALFVLWERAEEPLGPLVERAASADIALAIGPEGGISEDEARRAREHGAVLASLGPSILRTETAAVVAAAVALDRSGRMRSPAARADDVR